ncbi:MAG: hypothetical protein H3C48_09875 [Chitinophagaceae bacterium]|nr:hypothetical protein [Chitinophagaceae bacterium]
MKRILFLVIITFVLYNCNTHPESQATEQETASTEGEADENIPMVIELDNGNKWTVNDEMKPFVSKGEELVNSYLQSQQTDYKQLAQQLKEENNQLIKSCTMDGRSHEELHKWLHPHLEMVEELAKEEDAGKAKELVAQLQKSYETYHQYFN